MTTVSPYEGLPPLDWPARTRELISAYPLSTEDLIEATLNAWASIFQSSLGGFHIGVDIFPKQQVMGFFLHELIPLELSRKYPGLWRPDRRSNEKDLVYMPDPAFSAEIKTSSHPSKIFGNRSYAQESTRGKGKKDKSGYYLAVNCEPFTFTSTREPVITAMPQIGKIRFGWLDHTDWTGQAAATGQQSSLSSDVENGKLLTLYARATPKNAQG